MVKDDTHEGSCAERKGQLVDKESVTRTLTSQRHLREPVEVTYLVEYKQAKKAQLLESGEGPIKDKPERVSGELANITDQVQYLTHRQRIPQHQSPRSLAPASKAIV